MLSLASLLSLSLADVLKPAQAQTTTDNGLISMPDRRKPGGQRDPLLEAPERRKPGGKRDLELWAQGNRCNFDQERLTALIPKNLLGKTVSASPSLFFSIPAIPKSISVEFVLRDQNDQLVYETSFKGTEKVGIINLTIPTQTKESLLKNQQEYHWYLSIICNAQDRAKDVVVEGLLQRINLNPDLEKQFAQATPIDRVKLYQTHNLWQDTLSILAALKQANPSDPKVLELWQQLLASVELDEAIAQEPLNSEF